MNETKRNLESIFNLVCAEILDKSIDQVPSFSEFDELETKNRICLKMLTIEGICVSMLFLARTNCESGNISAQHGVAMLTIGGGLSNSQRIIELKEPRDTIRMLKVFNDAAAEYMHDYGYISAEYYAKKCLDRVRAVMQQPPLPNQEA